MTRLFRQPVSSFGSWISLAIFTLAYLSVLAFVLVPDLANLLVAGAQ